MRRPKGICRRRLAAGAWVALAFALTFSCGASAVDKPPAEEPLRFECRWTDAAITIDGRADERAWSKAEVVDNFRQAWRREDERLPKARTAAKFLWDREYLYFFAEMRDADLQAKVTEHDGKVWNDDAFELFLKPAADKPGYYELNFNPLNTVMDVFFPRRDHRLWEQGRHEGDFDIESAVQLKGTLNDAADRDEGWTIEGRIPWKSFLRTGGRPEPGERWPFAPCRVDVSAEPEEEELSSAAVLKSKPQADFHNAVDYALLHFVGPGASVATDKPFGMTRLAPLTSSTVVGSPDPAKPFSVVDAYPKLKLNHPIFVARQPGSDRMWAIGAAGAYGATFLARFVDDPEVDRFETIAPFDGLAYSICFHPKFAENGYVYVGRNGPLGGDERKCQIVRYTVDRNPPYAVDLKSETVIIEWASAGHDGCALAFLPDGTLLITSGDGTSDSDKWLSGQDLTRLLAKVLRIDVDHPVPGKHYSVPPDNPFVGQPNVVPETWAYGLRNPWRMDVDPKTGHVWVAQNGQDHWESVLLIERGANYGWSLVEGSHPFYPNRKRGPHPIAKPVAEHPHSEARSLTGGIVYHGAEFPELAGAYLYGDYSTGKVWAIRADERRQVTFHQEIADTTVQITSFGLSTRGEVLITDSGGNRIVRLQREPKDSARPAFPRTLSSSGLFKDVRTHRMAGGVVPYSVNAELWSDGAHKERFIAIPHKPGEDRRIGVTSERGWEFPNETVLVKSFALETEAGNPASRRWIETRFFTKQEGEWAGYSYRWNDEQTDATLVDGGGRDETFSIRDAGAEGGVRKLTWRYPSRAECMVCHSRAANFVLGLQTLQMNRDHDYAAVGGPVDNQLRTLEALGMLRVTSPVNAEKILKADAAKKGLDREAATAHVKALSPQPGQRGVVASSCLLLDEPAAHPKLADPYDASADLNARARSYLHANCAYCHVESGGGNALIELEFTRPAERMNLIAADPVHDAFAPPGAKLVAPGNPDGSVLLHRLSARTAAGHPGQMPPLATNVPDERAIELLRQWIAQLPPAK